MTDIDAEKNRLRQRLKGQLARLPAAYLAASDAAISARLRALPRIVAARTVFCYISVGAEPDTRALIAEWLARGKRVCVPRCQGGGAMQAVPITGLEETVPGFYGLPEPPAGAPALPPEELDCVVVPCVAADRRGMRLGNGGGYYDRYLARVACPSVCLCRGRLMQRDLPADAYDVPVSLVLTEDGARPTRPGGFC
jgi:5-formyltetrahydrofolate cyclo-ligase